MTTTDLWISEAGVGRVINYSGGLFGPAADGFHRLKKLVASGEATGTFDMSSGDFRLSGAVLMPLIRSLGDGYRIFNGVHELVLASVMELVVKPDRQYVASFVEF